MLANPAVLEERVRNYSYTRSNSGRIPAHSKHTSRPSLMFQIGSATDSAVMHGHNCKTHTAFTDMYGAERGDRRMIHDKHHHHTQRRRSTMSHGQVENKQHTRYLNLQTVDDKSSHGTHYSYSHSSPSLFAYPEDISDRDISTTTSPVSTMIHHDENLSWGHYIDVTSVSEDLDRRIDLYRQRRYQKRK